MKSSLKRLQLIMLNVLSLPFLFFPINQKKIVVSNFNGKGYGDNPKYIVEEIIRRNSEFEIVWLLEDINLNLPRNIRKVKIGTLKSFFEYCTAKLWIDNVRNTWRPIKRSKQVYLQTWHGSYGPKPVEKEAESKLSKSYIKFAKRDGQMTDAITASNYFQENQFLNNFWLKKNVEILKFGIPRNDILVKGLSSKQRLNIKDRLGIGLDKKVILYMPTFRDDFSIDGYIFDFVDILNAFERKFCESFVLLVRFHPNVQKKHKHLIKFAKHIIDGSVISDPQELLLISDFLISDYSSAPFDFMLLDKPVFIFMSDYGEYLEKRGLLPVFNELPFPKSKSKEELLDSILSFNNIDYFHNVNNFKKRIVSYETGNSSVKIVNWIIEKICE
ncbi:CDP-glycerol glycerophosphotransferase family protein [Streptococcus suis]